MAKQEAEWSNSLSIFWLKKHGYLPKEGGWRSGGIRWTYGLSGNESSIGFSITTKWQGEQDNIRLQYTQTSRSSGEKESIDLKIALTTTRCNYGGERYWFVCPLIKNGLYCGKRVGVLYSVGKYFGCRYCGEIAYAAQMKGGRFRGSSVSYPELDRLQKEIKREYYNGKPTRKFKRLLQKEAKLNNDLIRIAGMLDARHKPFADPKNEL